MLSCYKVHYLRNKEIPATFDVLAHSACHAVQLLFRYGKIIRPYDYLQYYFFDIRLPDCSVECITSYSLSYIKGIEKNLNH